MSIISASLCDKVLRCYQLSTILLVANQNICLTVLFKKWAMVAILDMILCYLSSMATIAHFFIYKVLFVNLSDAST
jgi:hypothetical protein